MKNPSPQIRILEMIYQAQDVVEAVEFIETAKTVRPGKSLMIAAESSRSLNSALF